MAKTVSRKLKTKKTESPSEGHNLLKLVNFMAKVVPDGDGIVFYDDGKKLVLHMAAADSVAATAIMPSGGQPIAPVLLKRQDFLKPYRPGARLSGTDGKLNMVLGHWRMTLAGAVEATAPAPIIIEGEKVVANVDSLKSVPTEDNYGGGVWAVFLPDGLAAFISNFSMTAIVIDDVKLYPKKPVMMQANAIFPLVNLVDGKLTVSDDAVGITGKYPVGNGIDAEVNIALSKPTFAPPNPEDVAGMVPTKGSKMIVGAAELRQCIEGAKKSFDEEATQLTFIISESGLTISLQSHAAALQETVPFIKRPEKPKGKLVVNTDVLVTAFKGLRELTNGKALAGLRWDENAVYIRVTELDGKKMIGAIVIAADQE